MNKIGEMAKKSPVEAGLFYLFNRERRKSHFLQCFLATATDKLWRNPVQDELLRHFTFAWACPVAMPVASAQMGTPAAPTAAGSLLLLIILLRLS